MRLTKQLFHEAADLPLARVDAALIEQVFANLAAVLAAAPHLGGCARAIRQLVRLDKRVEPEPGLSAA